jgi:hypothetical protein
MISKWIVVFYSRHNDKKIPCSPRHRNNQKLWLHIQIIWGEKYCINCIIASMISHYHFSISNYKSKQHTHDVLHFEQQIQNKSCSRHVMMNKIFDTRIYSSNNYVTVTDTHAPDVLRLIYIDYLQNLTDYLFKTRTEDQEKIKTVTRSFK